MKKIVGIDIGGTKISIILTNAGGARLAWAVIPTLTGARSREAVRRMVATIEGLLKDSAIRNRDLGGIGVGVPGPVDIDRGVVPWSPNLPGWEGIPLKKILKRRFSVPVAIDNDANAAAYGEKVFGAAKKVQDVVYITVSTGIGGGLVLGGKIHRGQAFCGGEVGHMTLVPGGNRCKCGKRGCLEAYASGTAIAKMARSRIREGVKSKLTGMAGGLFHITAERIDQAARLGDKLSIETFRVAGRYLGIGVANLLNAINPGMVILGGSVMKAGPSLWKPMMESVRREAWPVAVRSCRIRKASLGPYAGNLGAAALVLEDGRRG